MNKVVQGLKISTCLAVAALMMACAGDQNRRSTGEVIDDTGIKTKLVAALVNDPEIKSATVNTDVDRGMVRLNGSVRSAQEKKKAEDIAWGIKGVSKVENNLEIVHTPPVQ